MLRFLLGAFSAMLLMGAGLFLWQGAAHTDRALPGAPATTAAATQGALGDPPAASDKIREQKRFSRYDKDRNGAVSRDEYLASRRRAFAKLDKNGDGKLDFDEYAVKTIDKFGAADADHDGALNATEFATTKAQRKSRGLAGCPPAEQAAKGEGEEG